MANEFIARKGLVVLSNGAKVTGSLNVQGDIDATGYNVTASNLSLLGSASINGDITIGGNLTVGNADLDVVKFLAEVSSSIVPDINNAFDLGSGSKYWRDLYVSGTAYIDTVQATTINLDSITVVNDLVVEGDSFLGNSSSDVVSITGSTVSTGPIIAQAFSGSLTGSLKGELIGTSSWANYASTASYISGGIALPDGLDVTGSLIVSGAIITTGSVFVSQAVQATSFSGSFSGSGAQITNIPNSGLVNSSITVNAGSGLEQGGTVALGSSVTVALNTSSAHFVTGARSTISSTDTVGASGINLRYNPLTGVISGSLVNSDITVNAGSGLSGGGSVALGSSTTVTLDTSSVHFTEGVKSKLNTDGVVSSSVQIDVRNTTGIATIATTGSNLFTGTQSISDTTNSTNYADGALTVAGGVGIAKDVNISGSLTVLGLVNAVSMSTQYVTSSQYTIGTSRVIVNDNDLIRFAGLSVIDSGSTYGTGSLLWDSFENRWIYQADDQAYNSAIIIAGPKNTGSLGDEVGLISGRIPVATGDDHIDTNPTITPLRVEGLTLHVEENIYVTGSVTASAFTGDGSQLTGIVTNLNLSGSQGGTGTVSLKTQALTVSGSNGVEATVNNQTITISGSDATTTTKGVASFTGSNFTVVGGEVAAKTITFNGTSLDLGSSYSFGLQNITPQGAATTDQLTLNGGAIIHGVLYSSGSNLDVDSGTEVVASVATGSYDAAFFDYVVKKGGNYRAGTVMAVWEAGTTNVEFTDTSTNDLGSTNDIVFTVDILSATARLKATAASNDWIVKTAVRAL